MAEEFADLLQRVRAGDEQACARLVEEFGPELRRVVRIRLAEPLLQSTLDTSDVCQSVLLDLFLRLRLGQYDFASPRDLVRLLVTMARHKLINHVRRARYERRAPQADAGRAGDQLTQVPDGGESPSTLVAGNELLQRARALLSAEEAALAEHRRAGRGWDEIARLTGDSPEAARKRLARAIDRVVQQLGLQAEPS
jgi:RNA polymerase sigma factor (sigma-70 family)